MPISRFCSRRLKRNSVGLACTLCYNWRQSTTGSNNLTHCNQRPKWSHANWDITRTLCVKTPTYTQCITYIRKDFNECPSNIVIFSSLKEWRGFSLMAYTPSPSDSMYKFMNFWWQVIVYNMFNIVNVQTASSNIGSNEYWAAASPEVPEGFFSFLLITVTEIDTIGLLYFEHFETNEHLTVCLSANFKSNNMIKASLCHLTENFSLEVNLNNSFR